MLDLPKVHILLVDDNSANLIALEAILAQLGQAVVTASSGTEALRALLHNEFAVIILDVRMPDMDGFETARLIRSRDKNRATPIIFLTAHGGTPEQVLRAYELGAVDFLTKPAVPEILRGKVQVFADLYRKTIEVQRQGELLRDLEKKEHARVLAEARQRWEAESMRAEMEQSRRIADALAQKNAELAVSVKERERAEEQLRHTNHRLSMLTQAATELLMGMPPQDVLAASFSTLSTHMGLDLYVGHFVTDDGGALQISPWAGTPDASLESVAAAAREAAARVAREGKRLVVDDPDDPTARALEMRAFACFPLLAQQRVLGTLLFGSRRRSRFEGDELAVMQVCCDQIAMAVDRVRLVGELERRAGELAESDRRKDEFLAMLGHELRNPLAPLVTALQLLRMRKSDDPIVIRAERAMERQLAHMVRLVDDLLDVSRINRGKIELRLAPAELHTVFEHALQTSRPLIEERHHAIDVAQPPAPVAIVVDSTRLSQIISNLLNNAAKYTPAGGRIWLSAAASGPDLTIRVRDNGIGIAPEALPHIFGMFVQLPGAATRSLGGLGIGLTLVKRLVELHGGSVSAHSEGPGRGAELTVRLPGVVQPGLAEAAAGVPIPVLAESSAPMGTSSQASSPVGHEKKGNGMHPLRIVVVEDNSDIRETLKDLLVMCGHQVEVAEDGERGVEMVLSLKPDVALVDIGLPGLDGYRVAKALKTRMSQPPTRLVALTGYGQPDDRKKALAAGFDAHLVKPVDLQHLDEVLREHAT
jgi:signal transduction histidine kinase/DNA-binding response OmpR family regulator